MTSDKEFRDQQYKDVTREDVQRLLDLGQLLKSILTEEELKEIETSIQNPSWKNR